MLTEADKTKAAVFDRSAVVRMVEEWFRWMDSILDVHRANFVYREPTAKDLNEHKAGLKLAIRYCNLVHALIADPDFHQPDLVSRLKVRTQQLQDAYDTFHNPEISDERAAQILRETFPE